MGIVFRTQFRVSVRGLEEEKSLEKYLAAICSISVGLSVQMPCSSYNPLMVFVLGAEWACG